MRLTLLLVVARVVARTGWYASLRDADEPACSDVLLEMQRGEWVHSAEVCESSSRAARVLCSTNQSVGYGTVDSRPVGLLWRPRACSLRIYDGAGACSVLQRAGGVVVLGESFERHLYMGLLNVLTDDYDEGALTHGGRLHGFSPSTCRGERQYNERDCRRHRDTRREPIAGCGGAEVVVYHDLSHAQHWERRNLSALLRPRSTVLAGFGLHEDLNSSRVTSGLRSLLRAVAVFGPSREQQPAVLWASRPAQGALKPHEFIKSQDNAHLIAFNEAMAAFSRERGVEVYDWFRLSEGAHSFDGSHYGLHVNVLNAQLLLNYLASRDDHPLNLKRPNRAI